MAEFYTPQVFVAKELREISRDFTRPEEMIREAISNSLDAQASKINIRAFTDNSYGYDDLICEIEDDGVGMNKDELKAFFDLGKSNKRNNMEKIGEKGHGTKIFYNSKEVTVITKYIDDEIIHKAILTEPFKELNIAVNSGIDKPPQIKIEEISKAYNYLDDVASGTYIQIRGYDNNIVSTFDHHFLKDYILWFTAWGSIRSKLDKKYINNCRLFLSGIGAKEIEEIPFGHPFPNDNYDFSKLKQIDSRRPENHYVRSWVIKDQPVSKNSQFTVDVVFSLEGDGAKRVSNEMIKAVGKPNPERYRSEYQYTVSDRYGIYLCKDYLPIQRKNEVFEIEKSEWTKWHAFVNCQAFQLTANRATVDNTQKELLENILKTAKDIIAEDIISTDEYQEFAERVRIEAGRRKAELEKKHVNRRIKAAKDKNKYIISKNGLSLNFLEPRTEQGVIWILGQIIAKWPNTFEWEMLDLDSHFGYDFLVQKEHTLTDMPDPRFVECKFRLTDDDFNHSFTYLHQIICWETPLQHGDNLNDIQGKEGTFQAFNKNKKERHRKYYIDIGRTKIEVVILKKYLEDGFNLTAI